MYKRQAEELAGDGGPAQMEMGVVFPGEADAAEDLDAVLGAGVGGVQGGGGGQRGDQAADGGRFVQGAGGVPDQGAGLFAAHQHVGAEVFDRLELADGAAELFAYRGVFGGGLQRPAGRTAGLGGEQDAGQVADERAVDGQEACGGHQDAVRAHLGDRPGGVGALLDPYGQRRGVGRQPDRARGGRSGEHDHVGVTAGQDRGRGSVQDVAVRLLDGGERARAECDGGEEFAGGQGPYEVPVSGAAEQFGGEGGGQIRARERGAAHLLQDDGEVEQCAAASAVGLGQMRSEQALRGEPVPVGGPAVPLGWGVEQCADLLGRYGPRGPTTRRLGQVTVFLRDSDAHAGQGRTRFNLTEGQAPGEGGPRCAPPPSADRACARRLSAAGAPFDGKRSGSEKETV